MVKFCPCPSQHHGLPHCKCALLCCDKFPIIIIPHQETNKDATNTCSAIRFHFSRNVSRCNVNDIHTYEEQTICSMCYTDISFVRILKAYIRKELVLLETLISEFKDKYYTP